MRGSGFGSVVGDDGAGGLPSDRRAFLRLERAVSQLLAARDGLERRARVAEARTAEVEALLRRLAGGELDPGALAERVRQLESENEDLLRRIDEAREGVERLLARIRFLEAQGEGG